MIDYRIFENSYLVAIITFLILTIFFYIFGIGFNKKKEFTYRYQIVISLLVWLVWKFYLYPSSDVLPINEQTGGNKVPTAKMNLGMWR